MGPPTFAPVDLATWRRQAEKELAGTPFERLISRLPGGLYVQPLYDRLPAPLSPIVLPKSCTIAPRHDLPRSGDLALAIMEDVTQGALGLVLGFDRAARLGLEPNRATLELVGNGGSVLSSRRELARALGQVQIARHRVIVDAGANTLPAAAILLAHFTEQGARASQIDVQLGADPLGALARDGTLPGSVAELSAEIGTLAQHVSNHLPKARTMLLSTVPYHEAGAHEVQELAFALATAAHALRLLMAAGLETRTAAAQIGFSMALGRDVFLELAKLRALRLAFSKLLAAAGLRFSEQPATFVHAVAGRRSLTAQDPWVNLLRVSGAAFAAILGGADAFTPQPFDALLGATSPLGRRTARNTPLVLLEEGRLLTHEDPVSGSYYLESLALELARAAWVRFQALEADGGMEAALLSGRIAREIEGSFVAATERIQREEQAILGVTTFAPEATPEPKRTPVREPAVLEALADEAEAHRRIRGPLVIDGRSLGTLVVAAGAGATVAELSSALGRKDARPVLPPLPVRRDAAAFEREVR